MRKIFARTTEIAGVCFTLLAFFSFISLVSYNVNDLLGWIILAGYAIISYCMFNKKREVLLIGGTSAVVVSLFVQFILFIINQIKYHTPFSHYKFTFLGELLILLSFAALALIAIATLSDKLQQHLDTFEKFWYVPAALRTLYLVLQYYSASQSPYFYFAESLPIILAGLIGIAAIFFATVWLLFPERLPDPEPKIPDGPEGYIKMVKHILLLFLTFGIWWLIWIYRTTKYLNLATNEEPRKPVTELLLCMFIPFYLVYWNYKSTLRIDTMLEQNGMGPKIGNVCIFWSIFAPFMVPVIMQDSINRLALEFEMGCNNLPESFYLCDCTEEIEQ